MPNNQTIEKDPIGYAVCQRSGCQQTHPLTELKAKHPDKESSRNLKCEKCGGILTDKNGRANLSQNPTVIPTITVKELEANRQRRIKEKRAEIKRNQRELNALLKDEEEY